MDLESIAYGVRLVALVLAVGLELLLLYDVATAETVNRRKVIFLAVSSVALIALATWMILNPPTESNVSDAGRSAAALGSN